MSLTIREIQPPDNPHIARIIRQVLTEYGANRPGFAWADPELDALSNAYPSPQAIYYVVTHCQRVIGGAGIAPFPCEYPAICELQKMYLLPQYRGQGIGRALMDKLLESARDMGYQGCYLETFEAMKEAIRLYEKSGFRPLSSPLGNSGHTSCNRFYLCRLTPVETPSPLNG